MIDRVSSISQYSRRHILQLQFGVSRTQQRVQAVKNDKRD